MEFEYSDKNSRRSKVYIAVGVIVALLVAATVYIALQASGLTSQGEVEMRQVVVAAAEIPGRKAIEEADVVMRNVPVDPINETAFTSIDEVLGRVVSVPVSAGQLLTPNLLASTDAGAIFSILRPGEEFDPSMPDLRAVSMTVPDDRAVGGTYTLTIKNDSGKKLLVSLAAQAPPNFDTSFTEAYGTQELSSIPVDAGRLLLGTWQEIVLVDFDDRPRERTVLVSVLS